MARPFFFKNSFAVLDIMPFLALEILLQTVPCLRGRHHVQPLFLRMLAVGGQHFDLVTALELITQRHERMVHLGSDTMLTDLRVEQERKIQCGRTKRSNQAAWS